MARLMALCSLPRTNPGNRLQYKRVNGPYTLYMNAVGGNKLPFGNLPRLLLAWVCTEAVRTQSRELVLGAFALRVHASTGCLTAAAAERGIQTRSATRWTGSLAHVSLIYEDERAKRSNFVWSPTAPSSGGTQSGPNEPMLWKSKIRLGEDFFNEIIRHPCRST